MSFKALEWVEQIKGLRPVERIVLYHLAKRANAEAQCWPSMKSIMEACDIGHGSVYRAVQGLHQLGLLGVEPRKSEAGRNRSSLFTLKLHRFGKPKKGSQDGTVKSQSGTEDSQIGTLLGIDIKTMESSGGILEAGGPAIDPALKEILIEEKKSVVQEALNLKFAFLTKPSESKLKATDIVATVMAEITVEQAIAKAGKYPPLKAGHLMQLWADLHRAHKLGIYTGPVKVMGKHAGKFAHLIKTLGGTDVCLVMSAVIGNWMAFGKFLKGQGLVGDFPDQPHLGFFLTHAIIADQFRQKGVTPASSGGVKMFDPSEINCKT